MSWRALLRPLGPVYGAVVAARERRRERAGVEAASLAGVVLSVGSLSAGGAGKTPFVLALTAALDRRGYAVRILSRGYGRRSREVAVVDPAGDADRFGDEPLLLARRAGVPVVVGAKRHAAGVLAESLEAGETTEAREAEDRMVVHVLDDGFQHRALRRDLDLVLLTAKDVADTLLPAGDLREPLEAGVRRADVLVLREAEAPPLLVLIDEICAEQDSPVVVQIRRELVLPEMARRPARPLLFSGIARPEELRGMLEKAGMAVAAEVVFRDHCRYDARMMRQLVARARQSGADGFVTTEKDAVKLSTAMRAVLAEVGEVMVPELRVRFVDEQAAMQQVIRLVPRLNRRRVR